MPNKVIIIISDTHLGAGGFDAGNKLEDFISDEQFWQWLRQLIAESEQNGVEMEFIINGDWIEFLQVPDSATFDPAMVYPTKAYTDVSVAAALRRLEVVHAGHPLVFQALADFLSPGPPRRSLIITFGNHDPELIYPQVQRRVRELLGAVGAKEELVTIGQRSYFAHGVYVEHGNAYTEMVNRFKNPDHPFDPKKPSLVERPPGSYVVTDFYNQIERERPWIDGVQPMSSLIFYGLAYDPAFALRALKAFLLAAPAILVNVAAASKSDDAGDLLLAMLENEDEATLVARLDSDPEFAADFSNKVAAALAVRGAAPSLAPAASLTTGPAAGKPPAERAKEITEQYWRALEEAAAQRAQELQAQVVSFGHIHVPMEKSVAGNAIYLNTGAWVWNADFGQASEAVWHDLITHPEKYMHQRRLTYARIDISDDSSITVARLLQVNDPPPPPPPPGETTKPGLWARLVLGLRKVVSMLTGWL